MSSATRPCLCPISQPCNCYNNNQQSSTPYASYVPYNQSASHYNHATPYNNTHHPYQQATLSTYIPTSYNPYHYIHYVPPTPLTPPTPLRDTTNVLTEAAEDSSSNKRKKPPGAIASTAKRSRLNPATSTTVPPAATTPNPNLPARSIPSPAAYGVGPVVHAPLPQSASSSTPHTPTFSCRVDNENVIPGSVLTPGPNQTDHGLASDVWYFTRGLKSKDKPMLLETPEKRLRERPDREIYSHLGCILCVFPTAWKTWKNCDGQRKTIRTHLEKHHLLLWRELVVLNKLKGWDKPMERELELEEGEMRPFTIAEFHDLLARWISADDQSINVVECPELRHIFTFIGQHSLVDDDIPHRTKMGKIMTETFEQQYSQMKQNLQDSEGRISLTTDIWSRTSLEGYMGVTAHYIIKNFKSYVLQKELIAFRRIKGAHTGERMAKEMCAVLEDVGITNKLGHITTDNASNNSTMMEEMVDALEELGVPFHAKANHIRCFPHVINLAVKAIISALTKPFELPPGASATDEEYRTALEADVVGRVRRFVVLVRGSGKRRELFEDIIKEINDAGGFGETEKVLLREVGLLKDMDVRWSANFQMVDRFIELSPACEKFVEKDWDFDEYKFSQMELKVLRDYRDLLSIFHCIQEVVSGEQTPTLSVVLPMYEKLIVVLCNYSTVKPQLRHAVNPAIDKLKKYMSEARSTKAYVLAMVLNPTIKFAWLKQHWSPSEYTAARVAVFDVLLEFSRASSQHSSSNPGRKLVKVPSASSASRSLNSGMARFHELARSFSDSAIAVLAERSAQPPSPTSDTSESLSTSNISEEEHKAAVTQELSDYEATEPMSDEDAMDLDLLRFWQERRHQYPLLFRLCLDVLPIQASAVPSERVFSSSKETDTLRRANLGHIRMEQLQIMKYRFRNERLSFTDNLICSKKELSVLDMDQEHIEKLLNEGKLELLHKYIDESKQQWGEGSK